jgi:hypothetical protein
MQEGNCDFHLCMEISLGCCNSVVQLSKSLHPSVHVHGHVTWTWKCSMDNGHAAWTWTCSIDMDTEHGFSHAAWIWTVDMHRCRNADKKLSRALLVFNT